MSQSPTVSLPTDQQNSLTNYRRGWSDLNELLRRGGSLSGREQNCVYLNLGQASTLRFVDVSHVSGFDQPMDGRSIAVVDWDRDGDLDIWTSNRTTPRLQFFRNQSQPRHQYVSLRLQGTHSNRDAIGARVEVEVEPSLGTLSRTVVAGDAYLSQSSKWLHFGLSDRREIKSVRVRWPGHKTFEPIAGVEINRAYRIIQGQATAEPVETELETAERRHSVHNDPAGLRSVQTENTSTTVVAGRVPLPPIDVSLKIREELAPLPGLPVVWLLWSPECPTCIEELSQIAENASEIRAAGLNVLAMAPDVNPATSRQAAQIVEKTNFPFAWGLARPQELERIEAYLGFLQQDYQRPISVPTSLLIDSSHQAAVIYRGAVNAKDLIDDLTLLQQSSQQLRTASVPFSGTWLLPFRQPAPQQFASELSRRFGAKAAVDYFEHLLSLMERQESPTGKSLQLPKEWAGQAFLALGAIALSQANYAKAERCSRQAQDFLSKDFRAYANHGAALLKLNRFPEALSSLNRALELEPTSLSAIQNRAMVRTQMKQHAEALRDWEMLLSMSPQHKTVRLTAAAIAFALGEDRRSVNHYRQYLAAEPDATDAMVALAWVLATSQDETVRDGREAVDLVARLRPDGDYKLLNIQAAAWAEVGDFAKAILAIDQAITLAKERDDARAATAYETRRHLYQDRQPFRRDR